ncbi:MAG: hypothetical protein HYR89_05770 [Actinobacteria bacterium]|nr:hypothetical protein [Actinomycetota bacterium]
MSDRAWETALGALAEEITRLEAVCAKGTGEILTLARDNTIDHPFAPPDLEGTIPSHLVATVIALSERVARVQGEMEHALKLAAQGLAVSHELARNIPESHPNFIDTSL